MMYSAGYFINFYLKDLLIVTGIRSFYFSFSTESLFGLIAEPGTPHVNPTVEACI